MTRFYGDINKNLPRWSINPNCQKIPLLLAHYKADAGIAGGAALCEFSS
jgi:hypothetical protein